MKRERRQPTRREGADYLVDVLQQFFCDRPHCRGLDARALSLVLVFRGYLEMPPTDVQVRGALEALRLEDEVVA